MSADCYVFVTALCPKCEPTANPLHSLPLATTPIQRGTAGA